MDTTQWPQEMGGLVRPMEEMLPSTTQSAAQGAARPQMVMERKAKPQKEQALNCPRCNSTNTKFCYYNNYSLTQPRYFCKTCRRYWTEGGSLRNVPVGGGSRKNKRSSSSSSVSPLINTTTNTTTTTTAAAALVSSSRKLHPDLTHQPISAQNPKFHEGQDLNLAFPHHGMQDQLGEFPHMENRSISRNVPPAASAAFSAMELLRGGMSSRPMGPFMPMAMAMSMAMSMPMPMPMPEAGAVYQSGFGLQEFRPPPTLGFPLDSIGGVGGGGGEGGGYGSLQGVQEGVGRLLFPFEDLKPVTTSSAAGQFEQNKEQGGDHAGFWNGMIGGGGSW